MKIKYNLTPSPKRLMRLSWGHQPSHNELLQERKELENIIEKIQKRRSEIYLRLYSVDIPEHCFVPISSLNLSNRCYAALHRMEINTVADILKLLHCEGDVGLLALRGFGVTYLDELKSRLVENGYLIDK